MEQPVKNPEIPQTPPHKPEIPNIPPEKNQPSQNPEVTPGKEIPTPGRGPSEVPPGITPGKSAMAS